MAVNLNPYLGFKDNARQAMEFYKTVFGGKLDISTFAEFHASEDPAEADKVMHSALETEKGLMFMAADTPNGMEFNQSTRVSMSLSGGSEDEAELRGYWDKLSEGGTAVMPLDKAPWGDTFGMVVDKFGIQWMVNIAGTKAGEQTEGSADDSEQLKESTPGSEAA
jgi:PhnB protein